nr:sulfite exporter TauE/SafE family protein [uncultured Corynebacterium sp.]
MRTLVVIAVAGLATILLLAGLGPAQASAVVHAAELGTTLVSGVSHWKFGNVHWPTVLKLGVPGGIAAFAGATVLSHVTTAAAAPLTAVILVAIGINLVWRLAAVARGAIRMPGSTTRPRSSRRWASSAASSTPRAAAVGGR